MSKQRGLFALVAAVLAVLGVALAGAPAQASAYTEIYVLGSTHCLDNATENAAKLQMWSCTGGPEQQWQELFNNAKDTAMLINENTGWCITAPGPSFGNITMQPCDTSADTQQWDIANTDTPAAEFFMLKSDASADTLCLSSSSVANGTVPYMITCDPSAVRQRWILF